MAKENQENLSNKENPGEKRGDINGPERIRQEQDSMEEIGIREAVTSSLDELKAIIDPKKDSLDTLFAPETKNKNTSFQPSKGRKVVFSSFSPINTRRESDIGKGLFRAVFDSAVVFGGVIGDLGKDAFELASHPIDTTQNTVVLLKKQDPNIEIV